MGHSFHQCYYHFAWSTKGRIPLQNTATCTLLRKQIEAEAQKRGGIVLACNVMPDHVHLFVTLPPTIAPATYIGQVKGAIAHNFNKIHAQPGLLQWQEGYGVITLRKAEQDKVVRYVENQHRIHGDRRTYSPMEPPLETAKADA